MIDKLDSIESFCSLLNKIIADNNLSKTLINIYHLKHYATGNSKNYRSFHIKKRNGGKRQITAPSFKLKLIQKSIQLLLESYFSPSSTCITGYIKGKSIIDNATPHTNKSFLLNVDIDNFFQNITESHLYKTLRQLFLTNDIQISDEVLISIIRLVCIYDKNSKRYVLPQGSPCSPVLSNLVFEKIDKEIEAICLSKSITYTRYADDLSFSCDSDVIKPSDLFYNEIKQLLFLYGFNINKSKTRFQAKHRRQMVTGLVVNNYPNIPREKFKELRYWLYLLRRYSYDKVQDIFDNHYPDRKNLISYINGYLRYVGQLSNHSHSKYIKLKDAFHKLFASKRFIREFEIYSNRHQSQPQTSNHKSNNHSGFFGRLLNSIAFKKAFRSARLSNGLTLPMMMSVDPMYTRTSTESNDDLIHTNRNIYYYTRRLFAKSSVFYLQVFSKDVNGEKELILGVSSDINDVINIITNMSDGAYREFANRLIAAGFYKRNELSTVKGDKNGAAFLASEFKRVLEADYTTLNEKDRALYHLNHIGGIATPIILIDGKLQQMDTARFMKDEEYRALFDPALLDKNDNSNPAIALLNYGINNGFIKDYDAVRLAEYQKKMIDYYKLLFNTWKDAYDKVASNPKTFKEKQIGSVHIRSNLYIDIHYDYSKEPVNANEFISNTGNDKAVDNIGYHFTDSDVKHSTPSNEKSPYSGARRRTNAKYIRFMYGIYNGEAVVKLELPQVTEQYFDDIIEELNRIKKRELKRKAKDINLSMAKLFLRENNSVLAYMVINRAKRKEYEQVAKLIEEFIGRGVLKKKDDDKAFWFDKLPGQSLDRHINEIIEFFQKLKQIKEIYERPADMSQRYFLREAFHGAYNQHRMVTYARYVHEPYMHAVILLNSTEDKKETTETNFDTDEILRQLMQDDDPFSEFNRPIQPSIGNVKLTSPYDRISFEKAKAELAKILGDAFVTDRLTFEFMMSQEGKDLLGFMDAESKRIALSYGYTPAGDKYVNARTVRHEALHFIVNFLLAPDIREAVLAQAKTEMGPEYTDPNEYLSDKYELFREKYGDVGGSGIKGSIAFFFDKWKNALLNFFGKKDYISEIYFKADEGYYRIYTNTPSTYSSFLPTWL